MHALTSTEDKRQFAEPAEETHRAIKRNLERRHRNGCRRFASPGDNVLRQPGEVAEVKQSDVKARRVDQFAVQTMFAAQTSRKLCNACGGVRIRENREEKPIRRLRRSVEPRQ